MWRKVWRMLQTTFQRWNDHSAPRFGASLAFYTLLSLAPLLILVIAIVAFVFGRPGAEQRIVEQVRELAGSPGAKTVKGLLENAHKPQSGLLASAIGLLTLLFGASGVFSELRDALNAIWDVKYTGGGWKDLAKHRIFSFGVVLGIGFLLLVSLIFSTAVATTVNFFSDLMPIPPLLLTTINFVTSFAVITWLFAFIFKYVPDAKVNWRDTWVGALATAFLFTVGKVALGFYLGVSSVGSPYGAAGSLVAVIVWVYYSAQIFLFGAEFTFVYAAFDPSSPVTVPPIQNPDDSKPGPSKQDVPPAA